MKKFKNNFYRLRNELSGELEETRYRIILIEQDNEYPELQWLYLESEYGDENIEIHPTLGFKYARIISNQEGLLV